MDAVLTLACHIAVLALATLIALPSVFVGSLSDFQALFLLLSAILYHNIHVISLQQYGTSYLVCEWHPSSTPCPSSLHSIFGQDGYAMLYYTQLHRMT